MNVLLTGGAGYIGSHTALELLSQGHEVTIADNLSNSSPIVVERLRTISGENIAFHEGDVRDKDFVTSILSRHAIDAVIHFAGLKAVGESVAHPLKYYQNNLDSTLSLCEAMEEEGLRKLIFSSSASVYGNAEELPMRETSPAGVGILSPYGHTKYMIEQILQDLAVSDPSWEIAILRYFNPIGNDKNGQIGENPKGIPNNIFPYISQVAAGRLACVNVFGGDYDTDDGTCVRDYIHVTDLATGHVAALHHLQAKDEASVYNLGTGKGVSVLEMIHAFRKASGQKIPYKIVERRAGDPSASYSDPSKAEQELGWSAVKTLEEACTDSWKWQTQNPNGFITD